MDCEELIELISEYLDSELDEDTLTEIDLHIDDCLSCRPFYDSMRVTMQLFSISQRFKLPQKVHQRLQKRLICYSKTIRCRKK